MDARISDNRLVLPRCPHCGVASPLLLHVYASSTTKGSPRGSVSWRVFRCETCGLPTITMSDPNNSNVIQRLMPRAPRPDSRLPERARNYLQQAMDSATVAPSGATVLCASAVDAMLKAKGYTEGKLYPRIDQAAKDHAITESMADWAHDVRLDANVERHADEGYQLPQPDDAYRCIDFVVALGEYMFVLPDRIAEGRKAAKSSPDQPG